MRNAIYRSFKAFDRSIFVIIALLIAVSTKVHADELQYLGESAEAYMRITSEVDKAQSTIDLTYFIFNPSSAITKVFMKKVIARAHKGVRVRLLLDANPTSDETQIDLTGWLKQEGIQVKFYRPGSQYNIVHNNLRTHAKVAIFDGQSYITGGRNIEDDYYGLSDWMNYVDREVWVKGSSVRKAQSDFNKLWNSPNSVVRTGATKEAIATMSKNQQTWDKKAKSVQTALTNRMIKAEFVTPVVSCPNVQFTLDDENFLSAQGEDSVGDGATQPEFLSGDRLRLKETTNEIVNELFKARKNIFMENYSYLPSGALTNALQQARSRKIPVVIITNRDVEKESYAQSIQNHFIEQDNYGTEKILQLSRHGSIKDEWEVRGAPTGFWTIHGKVFVIDQKTTIVSSFNIDPRSYHTNIENAVIVRDCPAFANVVLKKGEVLRRNFKTDKTCEKCQLPTRDNGTFKSFLGWIGYNLI